MCLCWNSTVGIYAGSVRTIVDAGDVEEPLARALLHGLPRRGVPGPLRRAAPRPGAVRLRRRHRHVSHRCGHL